MMTNSRMPSPEETPQHFTEPRQYHEIFLIIYLIILLQFPEKAGVMNKHIEFGTIFDICPSQSIIVTHLP